LVCRVKVLVYFNFVLPVKHQQCTIYLNIMYITPRYIEPIKLKLTTTHKRICIILLSILSIYILNIFTHACLYSIRYNLQQTGEQFFFYRKSENYYIDYQLCGIGRLIATYCNRQKLQLSKGNNYYLLALKYVLILVSRIWLKNYQSWFLYFLKQKKVMAGHLYYS